MSNGGFGEHGGQHISETLMNAVIELEEAYNRYKNDPEFKAELRFLLNNYANRPSLLYYAEKMTKYLQSFIGQEIADQYMEKEGRLSDYVLACVGDGSNAIGTFYNFINNEKTKLIGCEAAGRGIDTWETATTINTGSMGIFHGMKNYFCQDDFGQIAPTLPKDQIMVVTLSGGVDTDKIFADQSIDLISMVAPTSEDRIAMIASEAEGFIYLVSSLGVTDTRITFTTNLDAIVTKIREVTNTPIAIGFGISNAEACATMAAKADGVIVGSAIVKIVAAQGAVCVPDVREFVAGCADAVASVQ